MRHNFEHIAVKAISLEVGVTPDALYKHLIGTREMGISKGRRYALACANLGLDYGLHWSEWVNCKEYFKKRGIEYRRLIRLAKEAKRNA